MLGSRPPIPLITVILCVVSGLDAFKVIVVVGAMITESGVIASYTDPRVI